MSDHANSVKAAAQASGRPAAIEDYGMIGDCRAAALISRDGSLDWLCWPRFDSPAIFAALLDAEHGGRWRISVRGDYTSGRRYMPGTNLLQTQFDCGEGRVVLTDFMTVAAEFMKQPVGIADHEVLRRAECVQGTVNLEVEFHPRSNYGVNRAHITQIGKLGLRVVCAGHDYWLRSNLPLESDGKRAFGSFVLRQGETATFSLSYCFDAPSVLPLMDEDSVSRRLEISAHWWRNWSARTQYDGAYRDEVIRSALTLKMLSYAPTGAIIAAPTTSLPELIGADLNWDYRYCWLRDASLTIRALLELGFWEEADDFMDWLLQATRLTHPALHVLYDVYGEMAPTEKLLPLSGYRNSRPVRTGNAAKDQYQLDVYGEVIDAAAQYAFHGRPLDHDLQKILMGLGDFVLKHWDQPDEGIWEPRSGRANHTHSRLLCWVAMDRLITLYEKGQLNHAPIDSYRGAREAIRKQIVERGWNAEMQSFSSVLDGDSLDASLLLISWYGFDKASAEQMRATHTQVRKQLGASSDLLYRYLREPAEGAFAICCFWEAEYLALGGGSLPQAKQLFESLLRYRNDLGLYAEEIDPASGAALGNFPQAFTHIGLIGAALSIRQRELGEQQLAHRDESAKPEGAETSMQS